ncbi:MAG: nuclear transport factor 2 family protein [Brevundimonas sp.]|uniref:nuclear transport factor 2 family protein n=1 Tax=Brevundimonas sp. TaxID=1871086 RepID=UPI00273583EB|nr:nuclear transport factor 2 family protein [Brevundimonas sp.]MDP3404516.1 nuclear transport factor 2 family protein [Brevundimonas sp.]
MSIILAGLAALAVQAATPEAEVAAVLDQLNAASTAADGPAYFALFAPDARFVGTDAGEHWSVDEFRAYAGPYFARGRGWSYPATERTITIAPIDCRCIAWFEEKLTNESYGQTRGSGVMRLTADGWKIEQYVLSLAIPNAVAVPVAGIIRALEAAEASPEPVTAP